MDAKYRAIIAVLSEENRKLRSNQSEQLKICVQKDVQDQNMIHLCAYYGGPNERDPELSLINSDPSTILVFHDKWHKDRITLEFIPKLVLLRGYPESLRSVQKRLGLSETSCLHMRVNIPNIADPLLQITAWHNSNIEFTSNQMITRLTPNTFVKICHAIMDAKGL